jgi:hypothetical protein
MIEQIRDHLTTYTVLNSMVEEHIGTNNWKDGEEFAPERLYARFNSNEKDKVHSSVVNNSIEPAIYRNHVIRFFLAKQQRKRKEKTEVANKLLSTLSSSVKLLTLRTTSHSRSHSRTPNSSHSCSRSESHTSEVSRPQHRMKCGKNHGGERQQ